MKKTAVALATTALAFSTVGGAVADTDPDPRPCVARGEFNVVGTAALKVNVHANFDIIGVRTSISYGSYGVDETREYKTCIGNEWSHVTVYYDNYSNRARYGKGMRVYAKYMYVYYD